MRALRALRPVQWTPATFYGSPQYERLLHTTIATLSTSPPMTAAQAPAAGPRQPAPWPDPTNIATTLKERGPVLSLDDTVAIADALRGMDPESAAEQLHACLPWAVFALHATAPDLAWLTSDADEDLYIALSAAVSSQQRVKPGDTIQVLRAPRAMIHDALLAWRSLVGDAKCVALCRGLVGFIPATVLTFVKNKVGATAGEGFVQKIIAAQPAWVLRMVLKACRSHMPSFVTRPIIVCVREDLLRILRARTAATLTHSECLHWCKIVLLMQPLDFAEGRDLCNEVFGLATAVLRRSKFLPDIGRSLLSEADQQRPFVVALSDPEAEWYGALAATRHPGLVPGHACGHFTAASHAALYEPHGAGAAVPAYAAALQLWRQELGGAAKDKPGHAVLFGKPTKVGKGRHCGGARNAGLERGRAGL
jgi:hypothetical protein